METSPFLTRNLYPLVHSLLLDAQRPQIGVTRSPDWGESTDCQPNRDLVDGFTWASGGGTTACTEGWGEGPEMAPNVMESRPGIPRAHPRTCIVVLRHWQPGQGPRRGTIVQLTFEMLISAALAGHGVDQGQPDTDRLGQK